MSGRRPTTKGRSVNTIDSGWPEEARVSEALPLCVQSEQLRVDGVDEAESTEDNGAAPTQPAHPEHERAPRIAPGSEGTAVGYIRVSTEDQAQGYSLDAQRAVIEGYCERNGYSLDRVYADEGVSARSDRIEKRPRLRALLADAERGQFDVVVVHSLPHRARDVHAQTKAVAILGEAKVGFASVMEDIDYTTREGKLMLTILGAFAEFFEKEHSRHTERLAERRRQA